MRYRREIATAPVLLFINPTAGRGRAGRRIERLESLFGAGDVDYELHQSRAAGDLGRQVENFVMAGYERIIVAGGDGSVHEAVNGIMKGGGTARLGVIPVGTGNDFAKACDIPLDWEQATRELIERITSGSSWRTIDVGRFNDRFFANSVGIGFDAKVTKVARAIRWPVGQAVYLIALMRCLIDGVITPDMTIASDGIQLGGPITLASISNGPWVGGMFHIAPMANNDDGLFDLLVAAPVSRTRVLALLPKIIAGTHVPEPEVTHATVHRVIIRATEPVPSHLDGEVMPPMRDFDIEVLPAALGLL